MKRELEKNPRVSARKVKQNNPEIFGECSVRTVNRRIADLGYTSHRPVKKPLLALKQRKNRVAFAKKYLQWDTDKWLSVLWSDESTFCVTDGRGGNIHQHHGSDPLDPRYIEATVKHPDSVMVWGAFSGKGRAELQVLPKNLTVNQHVYLELLSDNLPQAFEDTDAAIFQQEVPLPTGQHQLPSG